MTQIFNTETGILQQKESGRTILITKDRVIDLKRMKKKITEENAEEIAKAMVRIAKRLEP